MIWEPYWHPDPNIGRVASVYLNEDKTLIKRHYIKNGVTVNGKVSEQSEEYIEKKWLNESYWLTRFQLMPWVPTLVSINYKERFIIQEYYGPDLLISGYKDIPDIEDQIVEIYQYFKEINVYKLNGALSNMTKKNGKVIMFDFKYMSERTEELKPHALFEIKAWLSKITPNISKRLEELM